MTGATGAVASTVKLRVAAGLVLPPASVWVALMVCAPSVRVLLSQLHTPLALAVAVHSVTPFSVTLIAAFGSAVPLTVGVLSLVRLAAIGFTIVGASGTPESTVTGTLVTGLTLPEGSTCVTPSVCGLSVNGVVGVQLQLPLASTTAVQMTGPAAPSRTLTVAPGSPVPVTVGVVSLITSPGVGDVTTGAIGATVSTVNARVAGVLTLPAASVAVTEMACGPSANDVVGSQLHTPEALAVALHSTTPPSLTLILAFGSLLPLMVGVLSLVVLLAAGVAMLGALGASESTVNGSAGLVSALPLPSVTVAVTLCAPWAKALVEAQLQLPLASLRVVQSVVAPSFTTTVLLAAPVPENSGLVVLTTLLAAGAVIAGAVLLTVKLTAVEAGLVLPAGSVAVAVMLCGPLVNGLLMQLHTPLPFAIAVQSVTPPSFTVTVAPGSALPLIVGVLLLDVLPAVGALMLGAPGTAVSIVNGRTAVAGLVLPAPSVAVAVTLCTPTVNAVVGVQVQLPPPSVVAVQTVFAPSFTVTVLPGSAWPEMAGVVVLITAFAVGTSITGTLGATVSTVKLRTAAWLVLPAGSVAVANTVCGPSLKASAVQLQVPPAVTVALHTGEPLSVTVITLTGSPVPVRVGVLSLVFWPSVGAKITGIAGAVASIVKLRVAVGLVTLPSTDVAVMVVAPCGNAVSGVQFQLPLASVVAVQMGEPAR